MITDVTIKRFKRIENWTIPLGENVVFVGPNNSGKTTAIQAMSVWQFALNRWLAKRGDNPKSKAKTRTGVPITRNDLTVSPIREIRHLWKDCFVKDAKNKPQLIEILVNGKTKGKDWRFGMELEYQGPEMLYCRPMRVEPGSDNRMDLPKQAKEISIIHLPPLSGLQRVEEKLEKGSLNVRIGEGRAGDVLRNLLYLVSEENPEEWEKLTDQIKNLFQVKLLKPVLYPLTSEIVVEYRNLSTGTENRKPPVLDLGTGGSGFQQVLLLLAFIYGRPGSVLLLDEPDAHLETIRQKDIYKLLLDAASELDAQLVVATHSHVILEETSPENILAFLGAKPPHILASTSQKSQIKKSLEVIKSEDYILAEQRGIILYTEDYTDVDILREWSKILQHPAYDFLKSPHTYYIRSDVPSKARDHFYALRAAIPSLKGILLLDDTDVILHEDGDLLEMMWNRKEIENYLVVPSAIERFCRAESMKIRNVIEGETEDIFWQKEFEKVPLLIKDRLLKEVFDAPLKDGPFLMGTKASQVVLEPFFKEFYNLFNEYNRMPKNRFYHLAKIMKPKEIHPEVLKKLDIIAKLVQKGEQEVSQDD